MESERRPLFRKKQKPRIINVNEEEDGDEVQTSGPIIQINGPDREVTLDPEPSAPELESDLQPDRQRKLFRRLYLLLTAHVTAFTAITVLFVYVPHLRNIMRRNVFDKLLLMSYISTPLLIAVIIYLIFPSLRRRFAVIGLTLISLTIGWLLSYVLSIQDARAILLSVASSDVCSLSTYAASFVPRINMASKKSLFFSPLFMLTSNAVLHSSFTRNTQAVIPSIVTTSLMTHFAFNARSLVNNESLDLSSKEYSYALVQMYMKFGIYESVKSLFRRQSYHAI